MKRLSYVLIFFGFLFILASIYAKENVNNQIEYLSVKQTHARLITSPTETIVIPFLISEKDSFLTSKEMVTYALFEDVFSSIQLKLVDFVYQDTYRYQEDLYYYYDIVLSFEPVYGEGFDLQLEEGFLSITYQNDTEIEIAIGSLYLSFHEVSIDSSLSFNHIKMIYDESMDADTISGVLLSFDINQYLTLMKIDFMIPDVYIDLTKGISLESPTDLPSFQVLPVMETYPLLNETFEITSGYYFFPIVYVEEITQIARFPIYIEYQIDGEMVQYYFDDFSYITKNPFLGVNEHDISKYQYLY